MENAYIIGNFLDTCRNASKRMSSSISKTSACFICGEEFPLADLTAHEKACLDGIKTSDGSTSYTRQKSSEDSSTGSFPSAYNSNLSTHSSSSGESGSEKKFSRCYICGTDVPNYLSSIHEKNCKKSWETGLLNSICTPARKSKSKGDLSSLSRSNSKDNLLKNDAGTFTSTPSLTKSKSTTNIRQDVNDEVSNYRDNNRPRHLRNSNPRNEHKSKSITNLSKAGSSHSLSRSSDPRASKSSYDVRRGSDSTVHKKADPQYVVCQICGKLYSVHSILIHQRSCERTYQKQKDVGTNVEYKIKSKSLADLTKPTTSGSRPKSATPNRSKPSTPTAKTPQRPASAIPKSRLTKNSTISKSTGNLAPSYKRQLLTVKKDIVDGGQVDNKSASSSSPGLQTCYLCRQLYGTRSLPIHEKQCLKKWEREQEEEKKKKKKKTAPKKDIQIMSFGRSKFDENVDCNDELKMSIEAVKSSDYDNDDNDKFTTSMHRKPSGDSEVREQATSTSSVTGVPSPLKKAEDLHQRQHEDEIKQNGDTPTSIPAANSTRPTTPSAVKKNNNSGPKFVACVYCSRQFGMHSIGIHEKSCREKLNIEKQTKERIATTTKHKNIKNKSAMASKNLSKSVGDITLKDVYENNNTDLLQLIKCNECLRKFLKSDIEKHRIHCRVSVL